MIKVKAEILAITMTSQAFQESIFMLHDLDMIDHPGLFIDNANGQAQGDDKGKIEKGVKYHFLKGVALDDEGLDVREQRVEEQGFIDAQGLAHVPKTIRVLEHQPKPIFWPVKDVLHPDDLGTAAWRVHGIQADLSGQFHIRNCQLFEQYGGARNCLYIHVFLRAGCRASQVEPHVD
jgi:hypothetical protein